VSLRDRIREAIAAGRFGEIETIVSKEPRMVRHIMGLIYGLDEGVRKNCAEALAIAARYHPNLVKRLVENLVWAMDQRSGTYAPAVPEILKVIAAEQPELLIPVIGELVRLAGDASLSQGLCDTLRTVARRCPGELGQRLGKSLVMCMKHGDYFDIGSRR
jgi:hypothetical protein